MYTSRTWEEKIKPKQTHKRKRQQTKNLSQNDTFDKILYDELVKDKNIYGPAQVFEDTNLINIIIQKKKTHMELAQFLHGACFSPVTSSWTKAIKRGPFASWPGLTPQLIKKYCPPSVASAQGHMHQEQQGLQSTKTTKPADNMRDIKQKLQRLLQKKKDHESLQDVLLRDIDEDAYPLSDTPNTETE